MLLNRDRALGVMKDFGIDALLATTPVNMTYVSGFGTWLHWFYRLTTPQNFMFQNYALLPRDEGTSPALVALCYAANIAYQAEWPSWIEDLYLFGSTQAIGEAPPAEAPPHVHRYDKLLRLAAEQDNQTAGEALVRALRDRGLTRGVIAVDLEGMQPAQVEHVKRELPGLQLKEASELFRYIRMVKTPDELALLRKAAEVNDQGMQALLAAAVPGNTELDLTAAFRAGVAKAGGQPLFCNNACGPWAITHWEPSDNVLRPGDTIYCDAGCAYRHYQADTNVVGVLGGPTKRHQEAFDAQCQGMAAAVAAARPGVKVSAVLQAFRETMVESGLVKVSGAFGHAIGLEPRDMPMIQTPFAVARDDFLDLSTDVALEAGMVFNLEDAFREVGLGSVALEDTIVVTANGCESLFPRPRRIATLPI